MSAFVEHAFDRGFLLDEPRLRKLHDLIEARLAKLPTPTHLSFKVYRGDSYSYDTVLLQDVANEDNEDWRAITRLELTASSKDVLDFKLLFSAPNPVLTIVGDDRDIVFLVYSDVREYVRNEILPARARRWLTSGIVEMALVLVCMSGFLWTISSILASEVGGDAAALSTADIGAKLDYLIRVHSRHVPRTALVAWTCGWLLAMPLAFSGAIKDALEFLAPTNLFLFGQKKASFQRRRKLLANLFWGVLIAAVVSIAAGLVVWRVTNA